MPTYEYLCQTCHHRFEQWQRMSDEPLTVCPRCGEQIRRVLHPAGIVFKGHGFYKTDYGNGSVAPSSSNNGHNGSSGEKSEKPAESKSGSESKGGETAGSSNAKTGEASTVK
ncbi:MAG: zinc ribbon domain-containing protein [Ktedonobacteraceae bacterium]|nr:zinc ribbon domain-containing protein [Ktedonobacteraceae bacterium]